jgi:hypothetical protein
MATSYKILGQLNPSANAQSNVYVVPANTAALISSISIANSTSVNNSFSIVVVPAANYAVPAANTYYVVRGCALPGSDSVSINLGLTLPANTVLAVNSTSSSVSFSAFGVEIS